MEHLGINGRKYGGWKRSILEAGPTAFVYCPRRAVTRGSPPAQRKFSLVSSGRSTHRPRLQPITLSAPAPRIKVGKVLVRAPVPLPHLRQRFRDVIDWVYAK